MIPLDAGARQMFKDWNKAHPQPEMQRRPYPLNRSHLPPHLRDIPDPTALQVVKPAASEEE